MKKYKCSVCGNQWEAMETPFECPKCHSASISGGSANSGFAGAIKKFWWVFVAILVVAIAAVFAITPNNKTHVNVTADTENGALTVKLSGKHAGEYLITINYGEQQFRTSPDATEHTFNNLHGECLLELLYIGTGDAPKINDYEKNFTFKEMVDERVVVSNTDDRGMVNVGNIGQSLGKLTNSPEIEKATPMPSRINKGEKYVVTIKLGSHGCSVKEAEFSMDNINWQKEPVFKNLDPGIYVFYARNAENPDLVDERRITLQAPAATTKSMTAAEINTLLGTIVKGGKEGDDARKTLLDNINAATPVHCEQDSKIKNLRSLVSDVFTHRKEYRYRVESVNSNGKTIESLTVSRVSI